MIGNKLSYEVHTIYLLKIYSNCSSPNKTRIEFEHKNKRSAADINEASATPTRKTMESCWQSFPEKRNKLEKGVRRKKIRLWLVCCYAKLKFLPSPLRLLLVFIGKLQRPKRLFLFLLVFHGQQKTDEHWKSMPLLGLLSSRS
jgi:hypothetical protein